MLTMPRTRASTGRDNSFNLVYHMIARCFCDAISVEETGGAARTPVHDGIQAAWLRGRSGFGAARP